MLTGQATITDTLMDGLAHLTTATTGTVSTSAKPRLSPRLMLTGQATITDTTMAHGPHPLSMATTGTVSTSAKPRLNQRLMLTGQATTTDTPMDGPGPLITPAGPTTDTKYLSEYA